MRKILQQEGVINIDNVILVNIKCMKPLVHNPQFEGKFHCKRCAEELKMRSIYE